MGSRWVKRFLVASMVVVGAVGMGACSGGDDRAAEVGAPRGAADVADYTAEPGSVPDEDVDDASGSEQSATPIGEFEESAGEDAQNALDDALEEIVKEVSCAPVEGDTDTVSIGPKWTTALAYDVFTFEGPSNPIENEFAVSVLDPGFSAATLEWQHRGAIVDGAVDEADRLPTVAYYVSPEGQIDGLANADQVREEAIAINADLADEVSEQAAEEGKQVIEGLPDEALIALYASREVFFHSLDGYELTQAEPKEFATTLPDAGGFRVDVPSTIVTKIDSMSNEAGCVVVSQVTEPDRDELQELLDEGSAAGDEYTAETLPTFSNSLMAWVDGTTGEVRRLSRKEMRMADGQDTVVTTFDLIARDAE